MRNTPSYSITRIFAARPSSTNDLELLSAALWGGGIYVTDRFADRGAGGPGGTSSARLIALGDAGRRQQRSRFHSALAGWLPRQPERLSWQVGRAVLLSQRSDSGMHARGPQFSDRPAEICCARRRRAGSERR